MPGIPLKSGADFYVYAAIACSTFPHPPVPLVRPLEDFP